jgi:hypothetical protein
MRLQARVTERGVHCHIKKTKAKKSWQHLANAGKASKEGNRFDKNNVIV